MARELDIIPRLLAFQSGRAQLRATHLQLAIDPQALILCPIAMAGEDTTIHIIAYGHIGDRPTVACVPDPRERDEQYRLFEGLGSEIEQYFVACRNSNSYPQIWVPSTSAATLLDTVADRQRFNRQNSRVRRFGELLSYATEQYPIAGQQALLSATGGLKMHFATGQTDAEDEHLGAFLAWIEPQPGRSVFESVSEAERVPMGVKTDPEFDRDILEPLVSAYNRARQASLPPAQLAQRTRAIRTALKPVAVQIYAATQRAIQILMTSGLPTLPDLPQLEQRERDEFQNFMASRDAGYHLPLRDGAKSAAFKLAAREDSGENLRAATTLGDRVTRAGGRLSGHILVGEVVGPHVVRMGPRRMRYEFELDSYQPVLHLRPRDELKWVDDPRLQVVVSGVQRRGRRTRVSVHMLTGQRSIGLPQEGTRMEFVPTVPNWDWLGRLRGHLRIRLAVPSWTHIDGTIPILPTRTAPADPLQAVEALR